MSGSNGIQDEKMEIKISVIMGIYNPTDKSRLIHAVMSIVEQTFEAWEMILCDDGSDEEYVQIIQEAAELDSRIFLIRNDRNRGLGYSLNQCLSLAKGTYIARMDGDDLSVPERFEKEYEFLESHREYQWVGSNSELFDENGVWGIDRMPEVPQTKDFLPYSPYIHPSVMFRKDILRKAGGYPVSKVTRRCEDYELFMRLHAAGKQGYNIQENLLQYCEDQNTYKKRTFQSRVDEMQIRMRGFRQLGLSGLDVVPYVLRPLAAGAASPVFVRRIRQNMRKDYRVGEKEQQI